VAFRHRTKTKNYGQWRSAIGLKQKIMGSGGTIWRLEVVLYHLFIPNLLIVVIIDKR
jgi:hypothetical protein